MAAKVVLFVCAQALFLQSISAQYIGAAPWAAGPWAAAPCGAELLCPASAPASHGASLPIASASTISPRGVSVASENGYAGELAVRGALPFLGTVALEGALPTAGAAAVAYACGNGEVAMLTEDIAATTPLAYGEPLGYGFGARGFEGPLLRNNGCGCGRAAFI